MELRFRPDFPGSGKCHILANRLYTGQPPHFWGQEGHILANRLYTGQPPHFLVQEGHILGHWLYAGLLCHLVEVTHISNGWLLGGRSPPNNQPLSHYKISICLVRLGFGRPAGGGANAPPTTNPFFTPTKFPYVWLG